MKMFVVALLAVALSPVMALAGNGGGTKPNSSISVRNQGDDTLAVIVNPSSSIADALAAGTLDAASFRAAGGRFVNAGGSTTFSGLRAGSNTVAAAYVSGTGSGATVSTAGSASVNLSRGSTTSVTATGDTESGASLSNGNGSAT